MLAFFLEPRFRAQFRKMNARAINTFNFPYDFRSVMHYGPRFFTRNGQPTIRVKQAGVRCSFFFYMYCREIKNKQANLVVLCDRPVEGSY